MNFQFYTEKLENSNIFKKFKKENSGAYLASGFFIIDKEGTDNQRHLDFYIPENKQMVSFKLNEEVEKIPVEIIPNVVPKKIKLDFDFDFKEVEKLILEEMKKQNIDKKLQKILISLQNVDGKPMLICTVFIAMMGLLTVHIDVSDMKITLFEKKSFFDIMKRVK